MNFTGCKYIIVGSGIFGSVLAERITNILNEKVIVIEKRNHIGGNCYSEIDSETGIEYHTYGTHIFHTSNQEVWNYINRFTGFNSYIHQVLTTYKNKVYQMPINLETINSFYNINLKPFEVQTFLNEEINKENIKNPSNFEEKAISLVGRSLYEAFLKGYTQKQWQCDPKELPVSILNRLPFRTDYNESYFHDKWQGIPEIGYNALFNKLLNNQNIKILLNTDFSSIKHLISPETKIIYGGSIDQYFDYCYGKLEYRSLKFEKEIIDVSDYQGTSVMNYAENFIPYTRIHEPKHLHPERNYVKDKTLIIREYSVVNENEPYYPINNLKNQQLYDQYDLLTKDLKNVIFGGRLGNYKYYDMCHAIENSLNLFKKLKINYKF